MNPYFYNAQHPYSPKFSPKGVEISINTAAAALSTLPTNKLAEYGNGWLHWVFLYFKPYFQVTTQYVCRKLLIILFPFFHKDWQRIQTSDVSALSMPGKVPVYSSDFSTLSSTAFVPVLFALPAQDLNAPDLYVPSMAFATYVVLCGIASGIERNFRPEILGITASTALVFTVIRALVIRLGSYLLDFGGHVSWIDILCYIGYSYVGLVVTVMFSLFVPGTASLVLWAYTCISFAYYLIKSLKLVLIHQSNIGSRSKRRRLNFLFLVVIIEAVFSYLLIARSTR